ncbi:MAG: relaxase/mobilization nuclease domain-containing protein [Oligoflexia bacterium]|nr:relaxase/mobilization nuclease domain-containing protein [Oligoflexia bacterium]
MIANQTKGKGFGGALTYLLSKENAQIIGGNMMGENIKELTSEFKKSRELRPNLQKCVWHGSLSLPHGETLSNEKWGKLGTQYANNMGFNGSQFVIVRHYDTQHEHIHILASRVRLDGSVVSDSNDYKRSEKIVRKLEKNFGLTPTISSFEIGRKALTKGELQKTIREQNLSTKVLLQHHIDIATRDCPSTKVFVDRLEEKNIWVIPNMAKNGTITGISFSLDGEIMKGSDLGRNYSWNNLIKSGGITYDKQNRDYARLIEAKSKSRDLYSKGRGKSNRQGDFTLYRKLRKAIKAHFRGRKSDLSKNKKGSRGNEQSQQANHLYTQFTEEYFRGSFTRSQVERVLLEFYSRDDSSREFSDFLDRHHIRDQIFSISLKGKKKVKNRERSRSKSKGLEL